MFPSEFDELVDSLTEIPGISKKQARKIINYFLTLDRTHLDQNIKNFINKLEKIKKCSICNFWTIEDKCKICLSKNRENKLMIVENSSQIEKFEEWKIFNGKYYVVPVLFSKKFEQVKNFDFSFLNNYVNSFDEIIIGISPTPEGIITSNFIYDSIKKVYPNKQISKLAVGIPLGTSLDYMDQLTMSYAIKNRKNIK